MVDCWVGQKAGDWEIPSVVDSVEQMAALKEFAKAAPSVVTMADMSVDLKADETAAMSAVSMAHRLAATSDTQKVSSLAVYLVEMLVEMLADRLAVHLAVY